MRACLLTGVLALTLIFASATASEEGAFTFHKFRFESRDESGTVIVSGTAQFKSIDSLRIDAFHKSFTLTAAQLKQLRGLILNSIQLSGEGGYAEFGGRTIYLLLSTGFTSGIT
jgi:hypothetical protein